jgi:uncharacterized protein (DUF58 family)
MWFRRILRRADPFKGGAPALDRESYRDETLSLSPRALRQLNRLQIAASRYLPGTAAGLRPSLRRRPSYDFREHRLYVPGDDVRYVDWKASARQEHIFIKQGEHPKEVTAHLLIDGSASMAWGDPPKIGKTLALAAAMGYLALAHGDRLRIHPLTPNGSRLLGPFGGKGQVPTLMNALRSLRFEGVVDLEKQVEAFAKTNRGGLVLLFSDLLGLADLSRLLASLPTPTWDVIVFHLLHPAELKPDVRGDFHMIDIETGSGANYDIDGKALKQYVALLAAWRERLEVSCVEGRAFYCLIATDWSLEGEIIPHLRKLQVVVPL